MIPRWLRAKSHWRAISDLFRTNQTWNRPVTKKFLRKATVALENKICEQTPRHAVSALRFPVNPPLLAVYIHKIATRGISKYVTTKNSRSDCFLLFLVLQQQANINLMICCLLFMGNLRVQKLLLIRCIRRQRKRYRRRASCYWTLPRPVESWFEIHYFDRTIPGDYFWRLLRMNRESFDLLLNVIRNRLTRQNTILRNCLTPEKVLACGFLRLAHGNS